MRILRPPTRSGIVAAALICVSLTAATTVARAQIGDAGRGADLLQSRGCQLCHSVLGEGGDEAPDLGRRSLERFSPSILAALFWNHGPAMWQAMESRNLAVPKLTKSEVADLYAYFYSLRYFDPPGDAGRGKRIFSEKGCAGCHAVGAGEAKAGPPVAEWSAVGDPSRWIEQMWNHGARMEEMMRRQGVSWPSFELQEMVDMLVYLENLPGVRERRRPAMRAGDAASGGRAFEQLGCAECHSFGPSGAAKVDLLKVVRREQGLTALGVQMWNHRPRMAEAARERRMTLPEFAEGRMGDLLAYLFSRGYFSLPGNRARGEQIFRLKGCLSCHGMPRSGAPELKGPGKTYSPLSLASAVWNHGPAMKAEMDRGGIGWPTLRDRDIDDIAAFLSAN